MTVKAGTGLSRAHDAATAGREAATRALAALHGEPPALVIVYCTPRYDLRALLTAIRAVTGAAQLIGATGSGEFAEGEHIWFDLGVSVLALTAGPYSYGVASASHVSGDLVQAGQRLARASHFAAGSAPHGAVLLLADALVGDLQQLVHGVYRVTGPRIPTVGGAAGDELKFKATYVFHDDTIVEEGAVALWIASQRPLGVAVRHGWSPIGVPMLVTRAEGTYIHEIGGRPAALAYEEQLGLAPGELSAEDFWSTSLYHPFGLIQPDDSLVIRVARAKDEQGVMKIQGPVPPAGSAVQVMTGSTDSLLDVVGDTATAALEVCPDAGVLLAYSCAARGVIFGERVAEEPQRLQSAAGDVPTFGIFCCGEFARTTCVIGTHNATLAALAL